MIFMDLFIIGMKDAYWSANGGSIGMRTRRPSFSEDINAVAVPF